MLERLKNLAAGWVDSDAAVSLSELDAAALLPVADKKAARALSTKPAVVTGKILNDLVRRLESPPDDGPKK